MRNTFRLLAVSMLLTSAAACDTAAPTPETSDELRGPLGKADAAGTCEAADGGDYCGGKSAGACWCDDLCVSYGDCCEDVDAVCNPPEPDFCGGFLGIQCEEGFECVDDPSDECDPQNGGADCSGICVEEDDEPQFCGGIAGIQCEEGFECVDNPDDGCDPQNGGADCGGICVEDTGCTAAECGPAPGAPNFLCDDGMTVGGPNCQELEGGGCGYVFIECPDDGPSCEGSCGGQSEDGCWCDQYCSYYGDCCDDYEPVCEGSPCGDDSCTSDEVCVTMVTQLGPQYSCQPVSAGCEDDATCGCMGEDVCTGVFNACSDNADGGISCGCPVC